MKSSSQTEKSIFSSNNNDRGTLFASKSSEEKINLSQLPEIRVIVDRGRGFGNQRACLTAMLRMRELGFRGKFDIRYRELHPADYLSPLVKKDVGCVGRQLMTLIPEFKANENYAVPDEGIELESTTLGNIKITRLPANDLTGYSLSPIQLTITGADDLISCLFNDNFLSLFNSRFFFCYQPTDWVHPRIMFSSKGQTDLPENARLSNESSIPYVPNQSEQKLKTLLTTFHAQGVMTQLVYGLYQDQSNLDILTEVQLLIDAHCIMLQQMPEKSSLLIFPQTLKIFMNPNESMMFEWKTSNDIMLQLEMPGFYPDKIRPKTIYIAHNIKFSPGFFDDLMLNMTILPPVIEGCNSIETCEMQGRLYLHGSALYTRINNYGETSHPKELALHRDACLPLETGNVSHVEHLATFMKLASSGQLGSYAEARRPSTVNVSI